MTRLALGLLLAGDAESWTTDIRRVLRQFPCGTTGGSR